MASQAEQLQSQTASSGGDSPGEAAREGQSALVPKGRVSRAGTRHSVTVVLPQLQAAGVVHPPGRGVSCLGGLSAAAAARVQRDAVTRQEPVRPASHHLAVMLLSTALQKCYVHRHINTDWGGTQQAGLRMVTRLDLLLSTSAMTGMSEAIVLRSTDCRCETSKCGKCSR